MSVDRSEIVAARATACGIGLVALMLVWLVGSRLAELVWNAPLAPIVAFATAIAVGAVTAFASGRRLVGRIREPR
jgi:ABC-type Na+ efflux pump permease subunit